MAIDIILLAVVVYGMYVGYTRGIIKTIFTILSVLFGLIAAIKLSPAMTNFLETAFKSTNPFMFVAGFVVTFFMVMLLIRIFSRTLEKFLKDANINVINQFMGAVFMSGLMTLLYSILLWFGDQSRVISNELKQESKTYTYLEQFPQVAWRAGKQFEPTFKEFWHRSNDFMDRMKDISNEGVQRTESQPEIKDLKEEENSNNQ